MYRKNHASEMLILNVPDY